MYHLAGIIEYFNPASSSTSSSSSSTGSLNEDEDSQQSSDILQFVTDHSQPRLPPQERKKTGLHIRTVANPSTMGGSAFASDPYCLNTPRMPNAVYGQVKSACLARLRELYVYAASPIEGPAKSDHGDVDLIVFLQRQFFLSGPASDEEQVKHPGEPLERIARALGAEHVIYLRPHLTSANMAILWPEENGNEENSTTKGKGIEVDSHKEDSQEDHSKTSSGHERRHIQVDMHIAQSLAEFQWSLFRHAHGDFWQLMGTTIRPLGLTIDEDALSIRIPEIESSNRKKSKVPLTSDPDEVLEFLGLTNNLGDSGVWDRPFPMAELLFDYVATSRWSWVNPPPLVSGFGDGEKPEPEDTTLRSNDRRRLKQRGVYRQWKESYLPSLQPSVLDGTFWNQSFNLLPWTERQRIVEEAAFRRWPAARAEYTRRLEDFTYERTIDAQKRKIMAYLKSYVWSLKGEEENWRHVALSALKKIVLSGDESLDIVPDVPLRYDWGLYRIGLVEKFVEERGRDVGEVAWMVMCAKGRKAMQKKALKRAQQAEEGETPGGEEVKKAKAGIRGETAGEKGVKKVKAGKEGQTPGLNWDWPKSSAEEAGDRSSGYEGDKSSGYAEESALT